MLISLWVSAYWYKLRILNLDVPVEKLITCKSISSLIIKLINVANSSLSNKARSESVMVGINVLNIVFISKIFIVGIVGWLVP